MNNSRSTKISVGVFYQIQSDISSFHSQLRAVILWVECGRLIAQVIHSSVTAIQTRSILIDSQSYMHMRSDGPCPTVDYTYYDLALEIPPISRLIEREV